MSGEVRDGLARVLTPIMKSWGVRSGHGEWSDEETQRNAATNAADAALAYLAARPAVDVEAVARVLAEHRSGYRTGLDGYEWAACSGCEWGRDVCISRHRPDLHALHVAAQIAALGVTR